MPVKLYLQCQAVGQMRPSFLTSALRLCAGCGTRDPRSRGTESQLLSRPAESLPGRNSFPGWKEDQPHCCQERHLPLRREQLKTACAPCAVLSLLVASDSLRPHGLWPTRLSVHEDSPGKNSGVGCRVLPQGISPTQGSKPGHPHYRQILYLLSH